MNGYLVPVLIWAVNGLLAVVVALLTIVFKQHQNADEEHRKRIDGEIEKLRTRTHDHKNKINELLLLLKWLDPSERP